MDKCLQTGIKLIRQRERERQSKQSGGSQGNVGEEQHSISRLVEADLKLAENGGQAVSDEDNEPKKKKGNWIIMERIREEVTELVTQRQPKQGLLRLDPAIRTTLSWLLHNTMCQRVLDDAWRMAVTEWNSYDFDTMLNKRCWENYSNDNYYSSTYSMVVVLYLLYAQCNDDYADFLRDLMRVIDKKDLKLNSLALIGPPNCGKSIFTNTILDVCWNVGLAKNPTKWESFPFEDCIHRRAIQWNEMSMAPEWGDKVKELLEGHDMAVAVKYEKQITLTRTPIIVTANNKPWASVPSCKDAFLARMHIYYWNTQSWLKLVKRSLNPKLWLELYNQEDLTPYIESLKCIDPFTFFDDTICDFIILNKTKINRFEH